MNRLFNKWIIMLAIGMLILLAPVSCFICCPNTMTYYEWQYRYRIRIGMTLSEAESVLGSATKEQAQPGLRYDDGIRAAVQGDEFYVWERSGMEIWVGVRDGKICDKWFDFPSL